MSGLIVLWSQGIDRVTSTLFSLLKPPRLEGLYTEAFAVAKNLRWHIGSETSKRICACQRIARLYIDYDPDLTIRICNHIKRLCKKTYFCWSLGNQEREGMADIIIGVLEEAERKEITSPHDPLLQEVFRSDGFAHLPKAFKLSKRLRGYMGNEAHEKLNIGKRFAQLYADDPKLALQAHSEILDLYAREHFCKAAKTPLTDEERIELADILLSAHEANDTSTAGEAAMLLLKSLIQ